jgi:hypothetical protein
MTEQMRLSEGLINSRMEVDQHVQLTEEEDMRNLLMIGGIGIFLPFSHEEAEVCVADSAAIAEEQSAETVQEELEQTLEAAQTGEENEHSEEWLNDFIQEAEEVVALELTVEEVEEDDEHSEECLNIFSKEAEKIATGELAVEEEEGADSICFADLWDQIESLEERVKVQGVHIQQLKLEADEGGMGDHDDLLMCPKFLQLRRLHEQSQPLGAAGRSDRRDHGADDPISRDFQQGEAEQKRSSSSSNAEAATTRWSRWKSPNTYLGSRRISNSLEGKRMRRSS